VISGLTAVLVLVGSAVYTKRALTKRLARVEGGGVDGDAELVRALRLGFAVAGGARVTGGWWPRSRTWLRRAAAM
jgi:hypothetical protein